MNTANPDKLIKQEMVQYQLSYL